MIRHYGSSLMLLQIGHQHHQQQPGHTTSHGYVGLYMHVG